MKNHAEQDVSTHLTGLRAFFERLKIETDMAQRAQAELDRCAATRFSLFSLFSPWETHLSRVFGSLLDPGGTHGQGDVFLRLFLDEVRGVLDDKVYGRFPAGNLHDSRVYLEHLLDAGRRIDIALRVRGATWIGIENKPWAEEQCDQISDYLKGLRTKAGPEAEPDAWIVYLSGDGKLPETLPTSPEDRMRCPTLPYRGAERGSPSLENWVEKCRTECKAERVRWFLTELIEYIRKEFEPPSPQGRETIMTDDIIVNETANFVKSSKANLKLALQVEKTMPYVRKHFVKDALRAVEECFPKTEWTIDRSATQDVMAKWACLVIRRQTWKTNPHDPAIWLCTDQPCWKDVWVGLYFDEQSSQDVQHIKKKVEPLTGSGFDFHASKDGPGVWKYLHEDLRDWSSERFLTRFLEDGTDQIASEISLELKEIHKFVESLY